MNEDRFYISNEEQNVLLLIALILGDIKRIKYLKIPTKTFLYPEAEKILNTAVAFYRQHNFVTLEEMAKLSKEGKFDWHLFVEAGLYNEFNQGTYFKDSYITQINFYQNLVLEHYKKRTIENLYNDFKQGNLEYTDLAKKMSIINDYKIDTGTDNFVTINQIPTEEKEKVFIKSNTTLFDQKIKGFALGELSVWSGGNASSKSTYLNQLALEALTQGYNVAIYSGELTNVRLLNWLYLQASGKNNIEQRNGFYKPKQNVKDKIAYWLNDKLFVFDDKKDNKPTTIIEGIKNIVKSKNVRMVIIDNLMSMEVDEKDNKYDFQSKLMKELCALCKQLDIHIHFVCHPRKSMNFLRKNDISGTADITNLADNVFIMHRTNNDFIKATKEMFGWKDDNQIYQYSNVVEICKNREFGVQDIFVGMYFEMESRRLLNFPNEEKHYGWEQMRS